MEEHQREDWYSLEQQAIELLRSGNIPSSLRVRQLFRLLVLPSFEAASSWEICKDVMTMNRYFVIQRIWHKYSDLYKFETPIVRLRYPHPLLPTIEVQQYPLEVDWVEATQAALKSLVINVMVESDTIGLDGTSYEVAFDNGTVQARYYWWHEPPDGWRTLNLWFHQTLEALEQKVSLNSNPLLRSTPSRFR